MNDSAYCIASLIFADTTLCFSRVELIGEEIYDEFDPQGHPDLSSYVQAEAKAAPSLKRTGSAPQLAASDSSAATAVVPDSSDGTLHVPVPISTSILSVAKPKALPALRGLNFKVPGFQRSRSAPPTPRDADGPEKEKDGTKEKVGIPDGTPLPPSVPEGVVAPEPVPVSLSGKPTASPPSAAIGLSEKAVTTAVSEPTPAPPTTPPGPISVTATKPIAGVPAVILPSDSGLGAANMGRARSVQGITSSPSIAIIPAAPTPNLAFGPPPRSASPAPSLEQAILIERKRRAASSSGNHTGMKGGWFKSSPLNSGDARYGTIVAERVKRDLQVHGTSPTSEAVNTTASEDIRSPDEKDRVGPDEEV